MAQSVGRRALKLPLEGQIFLMRPQNALALLGELDLAKPKTEGAAHEVSGDWEVTELIVTIVLWHIRHREACRGDQVKILCNKPSFRTASGRHYFKQKTNMLQNKIIILRFYSIYIKFYFAFFYKEFEYGI